ncbi:NAD(P)H-hydrate epimerase [Hazenella coriacea]|uniref:Hydroxyethylthiazole kinase-like uncharacterized protein yjeF n=1 Tax=Hazenella coriacea TaxID=1179467 RepID=A0A4R3L6Z5_9BACL|nr:NAD(P)H-hydrate epimerase [Hazenella coriacea]TCS93266.1 hydroxyethylthiazole kinase-like uncharacterized protein yjeF [Hazenella coriacea]
MYLVTAHEMRQCDQYTIEQMGVPGMILMDHAGKAVAEAVMKRFPEPKRVVVLLGTGNNGGDGWGATRYLHFQGWIVDLWLVGNEERLTREVRWGRKVVR